MNKNIVKPSQVLGVLGGAFAIASVLLYLNWKPSEVLRVESGYFFLVAIYFFNKFKDK